MEPDNNTEIGNYDGARPPQTGGGKLNWPILLGAAILLAAAAGTYAFRNNWLHKYNRQLVPIGGLKAPSPRPTTNWAALDITPQPTPSPKPISPNAWEIKIPGQEIKATTSLAKYILAYGVKENRKTTVYKRNVRTGNESKAFDFDEYLKAENSGNSWAEMPPNIALALDNRQLAFVDAGGLKTYDMQTGSIKAFLYILPTPMGATIGPNALDWNEKKLENIYTLSQPTWSANGRYVSFLNAYMEGNGFGLVDTLTGNYFPVMTPGGYCDHKLAWSPTETAFVGRMCMDPGMFASAGDITKETVNLSAKFGKQDKYFSEISFSPDGKKLAFLFGQDITPKLNEVGIVNTDGTNYAVAEEPNYNQLPFFSKNGKELYYIQARGDKRVLMRHSWEVKATEDFAVLPEEFTEWRNPNWTEEGYLVLEGLMPNSNYGWAGSRLMILDMQNKKIIYLTPIFSGFTAYAGWAN